MQADKPDNTGPRARRSAWTLGPAVALFMHAGVCLAATPDGTGPAAPDAALGRLFMTPAEREELDARRASGDEAPANTALVVEQAAPERILLSGILTRSSGPDVVWINGTQAGKATDPVLVRRGPDAAQRVTLADPAARATARLKPGQVWTPRNGRVSNCFDCTAPRAAAGPAAAPPPAEEPATTATTGEAVAGPSPAPASSTTVTAAAPTAATPPAPAGQP